MTTVIASTFTGIIAGFLLRHRRIGHIQHITLVLIWLLLLLLGIDIGSNSDIMSRLSTLGIEALAVTIAATTGSMVAARMLLAYIRRTDTKADNSRHAATTATPSSHGNLLSQLKGSLVILAFFAAGLVCGLAGLLPKDITQGNWSFIVLCALLFFVGFGIGNNTEMHAQFRALNPRLMLLPAATIMGTLAGSLLVSLVLTWRTTTDVMAVGSGFAYYSLSSILLTEYRGAELGTVALLANIMRELLTLVLAPLMARVFGPLAPISAGGATTADTTMPIILRTCGQEYAVVSVYHGFTVDFCVPFIVTFFCSI